jgi:septation ring formation regulator EzrA
MKSRVSPFFIPHSTFFIRKSRVSPFFTPHSSLFVRKSCVSLFFILHSSFFISASEGETLQQQAARLQQSIDMAKDWRQTKENAQQNEVQLALLKDSIASCQTSLKTLTADSETLRHSLDTLDTNLKHHREKLAVMQAQQSRMQQYRQMQQEMWAEQHLDSLPTETAEEFQQHFLRVQIFTDSITAEIATQEEQMATLASSKQAAMQEHDSQM